MALTLGALAVPRGLEDHVGVPRVEAGLAVADAGEAEPATSAQVRRRLRRRRKAVLACAAHHGATNVMVFGSVARGEDQPESDIDLMVDLAPRTGLFELAALRRELTEILGAPVDVAPSDSLRPRVRAEVDRDGVPL